MFQLVTTKYDTTNLLREGKKNNCEGEVLLRIINVRMAETWEMLQTIPITFFRRQKPGVTVGFTADDMGWWESLETVCDRNSLSSFGQNRKFGRNFRQNPNILQFQPKNADLAEFSAIFGMLGRNCQIFGQIYQFRPTNRTFGYAIFACFS